MSLRFRTRSVHATLADDVRAALTELGWIVTAPGGRVNFGVAPVTVVDYQPEERQEPVKVNTVAVTLGDAPADEDEELGASVGGLRSVTYPVYLDCYMNEQAIAVAICDDLVEHFTDLALEVTDVVTGGVADGVTLVIEDVAGPRRPPAASGGEAFRRNWRIVELSAVLYFNT